MERPVEAQAIPSPCPHLHTATVMEGGVHFTYGDVYDDFTERETCLDCGQDVTVELENLEIPY